MSEQDPQKPKQQQPQPKAQTEPPVVKKADGYDWAAIGRGIIDWIGQFKALKRDAYHHAVSLETHWRGAGTPEESTRQSWAGMKELLKKAGAL